MGKIRAMLGALVLVGVGVPAHAAAPHVPDPCRTFFPSQQQPYPGDAGGRLETHTVGNREVLVLLPARYDPLRAYPVVYLFHGGAGIPEAWLSETSLVAFTAGVGESEQAIVVMPDGKYNSFWADWRDGTYQDETLFLTAIVPYIDSHYRTLGAAHRAAAGFSAGGLGALRLAVHHPGLFSAVASFSGAVNYTQEPREALLFLVGVGVGVPACDGRGPGSPSGVFGDPVTSNDTWQANDPTVNAAQLAGTQVSVYAGTGVPCDADDLLRLATEFPFAEFEPFLDVEASHLHDALDAAGVAHKYVRRPCGLHSYKYVDEYLRDWWTTASA